MTDRFASGLKKVTPRSMRYDFKESLKYSIVLDFRMFGIDIEDESVHYVFDDSLFEKYGEDEETTLVMIYNMGTLCGHDAGGGIYWNWWVTPEMAQDTLVNAMSILKTEDGKVTYKLHGLVGTTKQFRQFAKANFKFYRLSCDKKGGWCDRPLWSITVEDDILSFKSLMGEYTSRDQIINGG